MGNVFELNKKRIFSLDDARDLLPVIRRVTDEANLKVKGLLSLLDAVRERDTEKAKELETKINKHVEEWQTKIEKLGAEGKGLWLVDFDCGTGYYCWKFPEDRLEHYHSYTEGFQARVRTTEIHNPAPGVPLDH